MILCIFFIFFRNKKNFIYCSTFYVFFNAFIYFALTLRIFIIICKKIYQCICISLKTNCAFISTSKAPAQHLLNWFCLCHSSPGQYLPFLAPIFCVLDIVGYISKVLAFLP